MAESPHLSALQLDALAIQGSSASASEPPSRLQPQVQAHLEACEPCRTRLAEVRSDHDRFSREDLPRLLPPLRQRAAVAPRARGWRSWFAWPEDRRQAWRPALALSLAFALVLLVVWRGHLLEPGPDVVTKGDGPTLQVVARQRGHVFALKSGAHLSPGDEIRFVVEPGQGSYLLVTSVDGAGQVSVYFPFGGTRSDKVQDTRMELPGSVILDRARGPERVFAFFSKEPIALDQLKPTLEHLAQQGPEAIRQATRLEVPGVSAQLATFLLEKDLP